MQQTGIIREQLIPLIFSHFVNWKKKQGSFSVASLTAPPADVIGKRICSARPDEKRIDSGSLQPDPTWACNPSGFSLLPGRPLRPPGTPVCFVKTVEEKSRAGGRPCRTGTKTSESLMIQHWAEWRKGSRVEEAPSKGVDGRRRDEGLFALSSPLHQSCCG